ncbi:MAG: hypothetical protein EON91_11175 [Brevundimonas sp.]|uniref:hypothetical protein n=1 Tax=Brevundimonas sp. TaxID=1871086 RepID=UPI00120CE3EB|nr:hypothetical protein [Brevundimonas sp.]RZJ16936.1 MAG: hypothetical protein EON91_11175 [Brevundimonas sp.]
MLKEPPADAARDALDQALVQAVRARVAAGPRTGPDADAIALRALSDTLSPAERIALRAVWGRIEATTGRPLVVWGGAAQVLAADRYGLSARIAAEPEQALSAVQHGSRALMDLSGAKAWWGRLLALPGLRVVAALPDDRRGVPRALMISTEAPGPTGDDRTFWVTDSALPAARVIDALGEAGLVAELLATAGGLKLFALTGYVQADDGRLAQAPGALSGVIGAAPIF